MSRDVTGALRANMFSLADGHYPVSGRGNATTYAPASGAIAAVTTHSHRIHPGELTPPVDAPNMLSYAVSQRRQEPHPSQRRAHEHSTNTHPAQRALK